MRRITTLFAAGLIAFSANAKNDAHPGIPPRMSASDRTQPVANHNNTAVAPVSSLVHAKVTAATVFYSDTFNSNSLSSGGWVASGNTPSAGTWKFTKTASNGAYATAAINSTTAAGGWMIYDSDSIGAIFNNAPQIGTLTSPSINCSANQYVGVRFQEYTRRYQDTFLIQVSNNGGASWTSYPIPSAMGLGVNEFTDNPDIVTINVSAVAGLQANVKVRFYYSGAFAGGGYNWHVDDFQMVKLDAVDIALSKSGVLMTLGGGTGFTPVGTRPKLFADSLFPITEISNFGGMAIGATNVTANIYSGSSSVYSKTVPVASVPVNAFDSLADFSQFPGYVPSATGQYVVSFSAPASGDADASNNVDSTVFAVSDSSMATFTGYNEASKTLNPFFYLTDYYVHAPVGAGRPNGTSYYMGSLFELPADSRKDTITSVSVCMSSNTTVGSQIQAEIYEFDPTGPAWNMVGKTYVKTLGAADISSSSSLVFTTLEMNIGTAKKLTIANNGTYAAVIMPVNPSASQNILIASAQAAAASNIVGNYGISDSANGTSGSFGLDILNNFNLNSSAEIPAIVMNFGDSRNLFLGVGTIKGLSVSNAFPNPANTSVNIPIAATTTTPVSVSLFNMMGQMLKSQDMGMIAAGQSKTAVFSTTDLAAGMYIYTIEANGQRMTGRVVVAH